MSGALALLALAWLVLLAICAAIEWRRHRLRGRLAAMSAAERAQLARHEPEVRYSRPLWRGKSYLVTMLAGQLLVNGPVLPLLVGPIWLAQSRLDANEHPAIFLALLAGGFVAAWVWWSVSVSAWRWWALRYRDMTPAELQWRGESAQLLWPAHSRVGRTALYMWGLPKRRRRR